MNEDLSTLNTNTRNEKIKNFFVKNKKYLISILSFIILIIIFYFAYGEMQDRKTKDLSEKYNNIVINFNTKDKDSFKSELIEIINKKDETYSPLALYFVIDNEIETSREEINKLFDIIINEVKLDKEIKNLIIYKKGLFNADFESENNLINILKPVINSNSVWKSHALYLIAEYFYDKNEKQKAKEFYNQILNFEKSNENIVLETQRRLSRDFSE